MITPKRLESGLGVHQIGVIKCTRPRFLCLIFLALGMLALTIPIALLINHFNPPEIGSVKGNLHASLVRLPNFGGRFLGNHIMHLFNYDTINKLKATSVETTENTTNTQSIQGPPQYEDHEEEIGDKKINCMDQLLNLQCIDPQAENTPNYTTEFFSVPEEVSKETKRRTMILKNC